MDSADAFGIPFRLNWGEFLWAEPGQQDYLQVRKADGTPVQFTPYTHGNDERLLQTIDNYCQLRPWWRKLWEKV